MAIDKSLQTGSTGMLLLKLLEGRDLYGYEMIELLSDRSNNVFSLKAGTLYPLLHSLEKQGYLTSYEKAVETSKVRKYYSITSKGERFLREKETEWGHFTDAVNRVLRGGSACVRA